MPQCTRHMPAGHANGAWRWSRHPGPVARGGARRAGSPIDDLVAAARADRVSSVLRPYLEALA